jgi:hypothetical protein
LLSAYADRKYAVFNNKIRILSNSHLIDKHKIENKEVTQMGYFISNMKNIDFKAQLTKDIWMAIHKPISKDEPNKLIGFTDIKPQYYSLKIDKGSILTFDKFYGDIPSFILEKNEVEQEKFEKKLLESRGNEFRVSDEEMTELDIEEILRFIENGTLKILKTSAQWQNELEAHITTRIASREEIIQKAIQLYPLVSEKIIRKISNLFPMYSGTTISSLVLDLYYAITYNDQLLGEEVREKRRENEIREAIEMALKDE